MHAYVAYVYFHEKKKKEKALISLGMRRWEKMGQILIKV